MPRHSRAALILALVFCCRSAFAQAPPDFSALEAVVQKELKDAGVPGAAVAVVSGGRVIYEKGFGIANVETGVPMTPDLLFRLGSTTKMFTAAALAALADKGAVDLHKPVGAYIKDLDPAIARVTGHQLLSHTSGILDEAPMHGSHDEAALMTNVRSWKADRFFTEPGKIYSYSNPGYWLAGALIEAVSGKLYADQLNDSLFAPLGMSRTTLRPTVAMTYPLAQGHDVVDPSTGSGSPRAASRGEGKPVVVRPFANNAASWPAGSIFSSVQDLSRFVIAFVDGGRIDGRQAIAPAVVTMLSTPAAKPPGAPGNYGYGVTVTTVRGVRVVQHGGSRSGYGSGITMAPERQFGVIFLANRSGASLARTAAKAMEIVLGLPADARQTPPPPASLTDAQLSAYAGVYSQGVRTMEVVKRDGKLFQKHGGREMELRHTGEHRFGTLFFVAGADGRIEYLHSGGRSWKKVS